MAIVATLMDKARAKRGLTSDTAIANELKRSRQVVSQWRNGDAYPDEELIVSLAEMAGDDPSEWLVAVRAIRSDGKAGKAWAALAKRLAGTTVAVLVCIGAALPSRAEAAALREIHHAFTINAADITLTVYTLCEIMWRAARVRLRWIWLWIKSCLPNRSPRETELAA